MAVPPTGATAIDLLRESVRFRGQVVRNYVLLGIGALFAGMVFGILILDPAPPARSSAIESPSPSAIAFVAQPFLAPAALSPTPIPTATLDPPPTIGIPTAIPSSPTASGPTAVPTPSPPTKTGGASAPGVNAWSVAVIDEDSGALLYGRDPHRRMAPASLTKIFTALVALKNGEIKKLAVVAKVE